MTINDFTINLSVLAENAEWDDDGEFMYWNHQQNGLRVKRAMYAIKEVISNEDFLKDFLYAWKSGLNDEFESQGNKAFIDAIFFIGAGD